MKVFDFLGYRFRRNGKGIQATERTLKKGMGMWWRDAHFYRAKSVSLRTNCDRVVSQVFSAGLNGSVNWPWSGGRVMRVAVPAKMITYRFFLRAYLPITVIITSHRVFFPCVQFWPKLKINRNL